MTGADVRPGFSLFLPPLPVRERSSRKRTSCKPLSYLLTSDEHMNYVAQKVDKSTKQKSNKPKCRNNKSVVAPDNKKVKQIRPRAQSQRCGRKPSKSKDSTKCAYCNVAYGAENDTRKSDDWLKCQICSSWLHESCAEIVGVIDDDGFACKDCISD